MFQRLDEIDWLFSCERLALDVPLKRRDTCNITRGQRIPKLVAEKLACKHMQPETKKTDVP